jgi:hypothetical protein
MTIAAKAYRLQDMFQSGAISKPTVAVGLLTVAAIAYLTQVVWAWHRLSHIPGPFWAGFSKWWMVRESLKGRQPTAIKEVTDKYGQFGPTRLIDQRCW